MNDLVTNAVAAVLRERGLTYASHSQTLGAFNRECVRTGELPADFTKVLTRLYRDRQLADYEPAAVATDLVAG